MAEHAVRYQFKGIMKENGIVELMDQPDIPIGTVLRVILEMDSPPPRLGSRAALIQAMESVPPITHEEAEELRRVIREGQTPVDWSSPFEEG